MTEKPTNKAQKLERIRTEILSSGICPDLAHSATNLVMGRGSPSAKIVFIGEAPGKNEDLQGVPFVGAAGKFLDEMLSTINLSIDEVYITNIVKYRPPNNRDPLPEEKRAFWPFLVRELQIVQPKLLITLGRHSMEYFLPGKRITEIHGQPKRIMFGNGKLVVLPLYHPAAALYNGGLRNTLLEDFLTIPAVLSLVNE